jgi:hypothetical protein
VDFSKLKTSDWLIGGGAIVLLIGSFLPWFKVSVNCGGVAGFNFSGSAGDANGWDVGFFWCGLPVILGLAMLAVVGIKAFSPDTNLPDLPVTWGQALLGAGGLAAVIVLIKLLIGESGGSVLGCSVDVTRAFGLFISFLAAGAMAGGAFLKFQDERAGGAAGGSTPPTAF